MPLQYYLPMKTAATHSIFSFKPYSEDFARDPYRVYRYLRENAPVYYFEDWDTYLLSTYEDISTLVNDTRFVRTLDHVLPADEVARQRKRANWDATPNLSRYVRINILDSEGEYHDRLRKLVFRIFTPLRVARLRDFVQTHVDRCLDEVIGQGGMDFIEDFAARIPGYVIGALLGVPAADRSRLRPWTENIVQFFEPERSPEQVQLAEESTTELVDYLESLLALRRVKPATDLLSALLAAEGEGKLNREELLSICIILLAGGHGSTIDVAGTGMYALLQHPAELRKLRQEPALMSTAIQEMFRYDSPLPYFHRYLLEDMVYRGVKYRKGTKFGVLYGSANRDPLQFPDADRFDVTREPNRHLAFGIGAHFCLGNHLARLNMDVMFNTVLRRIPRLQLAAEEVEYRSGITSRGLKSLPVSR